MSINQNNIVYELYGNLMIVFPKNEPIHDKSQFEFEFYTQESSNHPNLVTVVHSSLLHRQKGEIKLTIVILYEKLKNLANIFKKNPEFKCEIILSTFHVVKNAEYNLKVAEKRKLNVEDFLPELKIMVTKSKHECNRYYSCKIEDVSTYNTNNKHFVGWYVNIPKKIVEQCKGKYTNIGFSLCNLSKSNTSIIISPLAIYYGPCKFCYDSQPNNNYSREICFDESSSVCQTDFELFGFYLECSVAIEKLR
jgi:hypothetical protein